MSAKINSLSIDDVTMAYGGVPVVHNASFSIQKGEFFGLIGLNGAGKTTLIKAILGLMTQESGVISIHGQPLDAVESKARLAYLPERFEPPWFLSGMEFVRFSLRLYKQPFDEAKVIAGAEKLALDPAALKRRVQAYSKGMREKLGLLATVLTQCELLVLDEPMSGLDPCARTKVKDMLVEGKSHEQTVFLSSHILADMDEICDRVAVLHDGQIKYVGAPGELKKKTGAENLERAFLHFIEEKNAA